MENQKYNEWYWNLNLHRDRLSLANQSAINGVMMPSSAAFYTSAVLTDVGICVGMRNVNLNCENEQHCFYPRKIPSCYSIGNAVGKRNKATWDYACHQYQTAPHEWSDRESSLYAHRSDIGSPFMVPATVRFADSKLNSGHFHSADAHITPLLTHYPEMVHQHFYPVHKDHSAAIDDCMSIQVDSCSVASGNTIHENCVDAYAPWCSSAAAMTKDGPDHVAPPKKKWIRNYMLSNVYYKKAFVYSFTRR